MVVAMAQQPSAQLPPMGAALLVVVVFVVVFFVVVILHAPTWDESTKQKFTVRETEKEREIHKVIYMQYIQRETQQRRRQR
jgi:Mn2+/Fe2+ NRAMP family transporter